VNCGDGDKFGKSHFRFRSCRTGSASSPAPRGGLKPGGRLILSVNHPSAYAIVYPEANYFALTKYSEDYLMDGQTVWLTFWHRPLHAMADAFATAGFRIVTVSEPPPASDTPTELVPAGLEVGQSFMCFLFFVLEAV